MRGEVLGAAVFRPALAASEMHVRCHAAMPVAVAARVHSQTLAQMYSFIPVISLAI